MEPNFLLLSISWSDLLLINKIKKKHQCTTWRPGHKMHWLPPCSLSYSSLWGKLAAILWEHSSSHWRGNIPRNWRASCQKSWVSYFDSRFSSSNWAFGWLQPLPNILTATTQETLSKNHSAKLLPNSWPLSFGVTCYTAKDN